MDFIYRSRIANSLRLFSLALASWILMANAVWAADGDSSGSGKGWVTSYFLLGLGVFLGLVAVLRPVGRTTEVKPYQDD